MQVRDLAEKYFGGWRQEVVPSVAPSATEALARPTQGALELQQAARAGPAVMQAFYRPSVASADAPIFDVIRCQRLQSLMSNLALRQCQWATTPACVPFTL